MLGYLTIAPEVINSNTYIPLRFVGETTGATVSWNASQNKVVINEIPEILLERLCSQGNAEGVKKVIEDHPYIDLDYRQGRYLLNAILDADSFETVKVLVNAGANVNLINSIDSTPLYLASSHSSEMTRWLLDNGADPNLKNSKGETAFDRVFINSEDRRKTAEILKEAMQQAGFESGEAIKFPYEVELLNKGFTLTFNELGENDLGLILKVNSINNSDKKGYGAYPKISIRTETEDLTNIKYSRVSGDDSFGKGKAAYEYVFSKPTQQSSKYRITVEDGKDVKVFYVEAKQIISSAITLQQLSPYLQKKYSSVVTDSGITEFKISVEPWILGTYRIELDYDSNFFWNKDLMTPTVKEQLRNHMKQVAADAINLLPNIRFQGGYTQRWYKSTGLSFT
ncbi:ankyrin repeat domain-containing protein [Paenibacillus sp. ACRRX]|uniref:ankyrin repeat domain-containing protein n=1 Tax=Paenibacillus sp. ACRRX TaxID=2918206 RepID=UPI001EF6ED21|nr:ankyrin repeat domain-containing protein [Paenibacillus sp. ACRRX]MCG7409562.1 ankyrin repeat domain-containing protein [Paenibacillus sp. ACRRX]